MDGIEILWNDPVEKIHACDGYIIVGGFSYEDRSRAGVIAALEPIMTPLRSEAEAGKPLLGICNGAQILVETGLVPGLENYRQGMALTDNHRVQNGHVLGTGYYNTWVNLQLAVPSKRCAFSRHMRIGDWMNIPIAHAEGRFVTTDEILTELIDNDQTVFRYCDDNGNIQPEFPVNPNGSLYNLAAVCNPAGNVMAMMPHPERTANGDAIFTSMREYIKEKPEVSKTLFSADRPKAEIAELRPASKAMELIVELIITDKTASSVHNALSHKGIPVEITRHTHWEIVAEPDSHDNLMVKIRESGELFNSNKENLVALEDDAQITNLLVRNRDDVLGLQKYETLTKRFEMDEIKAVKHGVLWSVKPAGDNPDEIIQQVLDTHILFNPLAHKCYRYNKNE